MTDSRKRLELSEGRFRLDITKTFFTLRVAGHWNGLPRAMVTALSQSEFMKCLDNALGHKMGFLVSVQGQELNSMMGSFQVPIFQDFIRHTLGSTSPDSNVLLQQGKIQGLIFHSSVLAEAHFFLVLPKILV